MIGRILLFLPAAATAYFAYRFSLPTPFTDEWAFVRGAMRLADAGTWPEVLAAIPKYHHGHPVSVSFVLYWLVERIAAFDSRALILLTCGLYGVQLALLRPYMRSLWGLLPVVVLYFAPTHWFEFLWGFMFTLALSSTLVVAALCVLDGVDDRAPVPRLAGAVALLLLAAGSSAAGLMGFPAAMALLAAKRMPATLKVSGVILFAVVGAAFFAWGWPPAVPVKIGVQPMLGFLTALGAPIWGTPIVLLQFGLDRWSFTGAAIVAAAIAVSIRAARMQRLFRVALPIGMITYSVLAVAAVQATRGKLANWLVALALPGLAGLYVAAYLLSEWSKIQRYIAIGLAIVFLLSAGGYVDAFQHHGPWWRGYGLKIQRYMATFVAHPDQKKPFPEVFFVDPQLLDFLGRHRPEIRPGAF